MIIARYPEKDNMKPSTVDRTGMKKKGKLHDLLYQIAVTNWRWKIIRLAVKKLKVQKEVTVASKDSCQTTTEF